MNAITREDLKLPVGTTYQGRNGASHTIVSASHDADGTLCYDIMTTKPPHTIREMESYDVVERRVSIQRADELARAMMAMRPDLDKQLSLDEWISEYGKELSCAERAAAVAILALYEEVTR